MNAAQGGGSASAPAEPVATPGALLRRERERRGLSVQQAAEDLHLDAWMIEAIEADRFQALGAPVYARGHLRKYALLLGLAPASVIELYQALSDTPSVPTPIPASLVVAGPRERPSLKVPLSIVAAVAAAIVGWWVFETMTAPSRQAASLPAQPDAELLSEPVESGAPGTNASASGAAAEQSTLTPAGSQAGAEVSAPSRAGPAVSPPNAPTSTAAGAEKVRVRLQFGEASWVEIYDASGNRLMFDMGLPGAVRNLEGRPPLLVTLGRAAAVSVQVNDQAIVLPRRANKDAARFAIEADGSVKQR